MKSQLLQVIAATLILLMATTANAQTSTTPGATGESSSAGTSDSTGTATTGLSPATGFTQLSNTGVGASADSVRSLSTTGVAGGGATTTGGRGGGGGLGGLGGFGLGGFGAGGFGQSSTPAKPTLRTRLRSSVSVTPLQAQQIQSAAQSRFYQTPSTSRMSGVQVNMIEGTAVINGVVGSEKDRRMSELLMRLEPGVRNVSNQIIVSP